MKSCMSSAGILSVSASTPIIAPAAPEVIRLRADHLLSVQALLGTPTASWQDVATIENVGGVSVETTGLFARPVGAEVEVTPTATLRAR